MRSLTLRSLQGLVAVAAVFVLTGAKGNGCGGSDSETAVPEDPPVPVECQPGTHLETICDDSCNGACKDECIPDAVCPDGMVEEWTCGPIAYDQPMCGPNEACPPPPPPPDDCWLSCVPIDPCGPGAHEEWICDPVFAQGEGDANGGMGVPPSDACYSICVPDSPTCGPGSHEEWVCDPVIQEGAEPDACYVTCVPDSPVCEPGSHEEWVCDPVMDPADPNLPPEACYLTCVPDGVCPPGTYEQTVCEGWDGQGEPPPEPICWTECVGESPCPPGQHQEIECYPDSVDGPCQLVCVDDGQPVPPPQPM